MNGMVERIRAHRMAMGRSGDRVGVVSSYCAKAKVDTEGNNRDIVVTATTHDLDSQGEVVLPKGALPDSYFFANRAVFVDHWYDKDHTVGAMRYAKMVPDSDNPTGWRVRLSVLSTPLGDDILTAAREMGIGASIGFEPIEGGKPAPDEERAFARNGRRVEWVHRVWDWMETSLTFMPANVACRGGVVSGGDFERMAADLDRLVCKGVIRRESARAFGLPDVPAVPPPGSPARRKRVVVVRRVGLDTEARGR
jgi:hypothetical protein